MIANDWVANDARFLLYPAMKELTLDIASMVFMGHEPGTDHELVTKVNNAFTTTTRAGNAIIRTGVPPFTWWRGLQGARAAGGLLRRSESRSAAARRAPTCSRVLCQTEDEDGNRFSDEDIVNHMIFLMMAAHDTSTSTVDDHVPITWPPTRSGRTAAATNPTGSATARSTSRRWRSWRRSTW